MTRTGYTPLLPQLEGQLLGGRYRVGEAIGSHRDAPVFRATDELLWREVRVHVFPGLDPDVQAAAVASRLQHPSVVRVQDWGSHAGAAFIVREPTEGTSIAELLDRDGPQPSELTERVARDVGAVLEHAHAHGLSHGRIDTEHVIIAPDGRVQVLGFGFPLDQHPIGDARHMDVRMLGDLVHALHHGADVPELTQRDEPIASSPPLEVQPEAAQIDLEDRPPAPPRRRRWIPLAAGVAVGLVAGAAAMLLPARVDVPHVTGLPADHAEAALAHAGLSLGERVAVFHDQVPAGIVVSTEPGPGARTAEGGAVRIVVSRGPELFDLPVLAGLGLEEARQTVEGSPYELGEIVEAHSATVPKGVVIERSPAEGRHPRGTRLDVVVSKGPELVTIPVVDGSGRTAVREAIEGAGFAYAEAREFSDTVPAGIVIRTDPHWGRRAVKGSTVTAVFSDGPPPFAMPRLTGMTLEDARAKARSLGLVVAAEHPVPSSDQPKGTVQGQSPPPGATVREGDRIELYHAA